MKDHFLDKNVFALSESSDQTISGITKKNNWQEPKILEMDYTSTEYNTGLNSDMGMTGNEPSS